MYTLFGTSKHASIGTFSIIALMVSKTIESGKGILYPDTLQKLNSTDTSKYLSNDPTEAKIMIAMCLCLFTGIIHVNIFL